MLNVPPNSHGLIADVDVKVLQEFGQKISDFNKRALRDSKEVKISVENPTVYEGDLQALLNRNQEEALCCNKPIELFIEFSDPLIIDALVLEENIRKGQHIEKVKISITDVDGVEHCISEVESVGYRRIIRFSAIYAASLRVRITDIRQYFALKSCYPVLAKY